MRYAVLVVERIRKMMKKTKVGIYESGDEDGGRFTKMVVKMEVCEISHVLV